MCTIFALFPTYCHSLTVTQPLSVAPWTVLACVCVRHRRRSGGEMFYAFQLPKYSNNGFGVRNLAIIMIKQLLWKEWFWKFCSDWSWKWTKNDETKLKFCRKYFFRINIFPELLFQLGIKFEIEPFFSPHFTRSQSHHRRTVICQQWQSHSQKTSIAHCRQNAHSRVNCWTNQVRSSFSIGQTNQSARVFVCLWFPFCKFRGIFSQKNGFNTECTIAFWKSAIERAIGKVAKSIERCKSTIETLIGFSEGVQNRKRASHDGKLHVDPANGCAKKSLRRHSKRCVQGDNVRHQFGKNRQWSSARNSARSRTGGNATKETRRLRTDVVKSNGIANNTKASVSCACQCQAADNQTSPIFH